MIIKCILDIMLIFLKLFDVVLVVYVFSSEGEKCAF